jgi:hypothetical protein
MSQHAAMHPIWQTGAVILFAAVLSALLLQLVAHRILPAMLRQEHTELGAAIFSVIGTTYAVLLAFMATTAWDQHSSAHALARHEADLLGEIYGASNGIPDPLGASVRSDVSAYLTRVINVEWPAQIAGKALSPIEPLLTHLQQTALSWTPSNAGQSVIQGDIITKLTDVATARRDRRLAVDGSIPDLVWVVLLAGGGVMVGFSYMLGAPTQRMHLLMTAALVTSGVLILLMIIGLSSPFHGAVTIPPDEYIAVLAEMQ